MFLLFAFRMKRIKDVTEKRPDSPFSRPPPLHIKVVGVKEKAKVLRWTFGEGEAVPNVTKHNMLVAISDGWTVKKITFFEELKHQVKDDTSYIIKGYSLRGDGPPYDINITRATTFYAGTANLAVPEDHYKRGKELLDPPSTVTPLDGVRGSMGLLTLVGEVVEVSYLISEISDLQFRPACLL